MQERKYELCSKCKKGHLIFCDEIDLGLCNDCQDRAIALSEEYRDWQRRHND